MQRKASNLALLPVLVCIPLILGSCTAARELLALRQVDFHIDRATDAALAGIHLDRVRSYEDLTISDALRLADAIRRDEMPFRFSLHITGQNPEENAVQARMVELDWTLFLQDRETISGLFTDEVVFPPGTDVTFPIDMELDLFRFFRHSAQDMVDLALNVLGYGDRPTDIRLEAGVTIQTPLGPMRYPGRITILHAEVGGIGS